jgi:hypothetical protein
MTEPTTRTLDVPGAVLHYGSKRTDGADVTTPDEHADDLHRLISVLGAGPPGIFATSGGTVSALALAARHPGQVRRSSRTNRPVLPDRQALLAACTDIRQTCQGPGDDPLAQEEHAVLHRLRPRLRRVARGIDPHRVRH